MWWLVTVRILPSLFRMIAATASAWITNSFCRRSASSIADSAVVSSGYPIAIRSAIYASLLVGYAGGAELRRVIVAHRACLPRIRDGTE